MKRASLLLAAPLAMVIAFFVLPLLLMIYTPTFDHYARFARDPYYLGGLAITVGTALLVTAITLAVSYPVALLYWRSSAKLKPALISLLLAPFYANIVVKVFGWMLILPAAWLNGYVGLLIVSVHRDIPFMVLLI